MYTREYEKEAVQPGGADAGFEQEKADLIRAARSGDRVKTFLDSVVTKTGIFDADLGSDKASGIALERNAEDRGLGLGRRHEDHRDAHRGKDKDRDTGRKRSRSNSASGW